MNETKPDPDRTNGHNLIRALWQTIKMRDLENTYLKAIDSSKDTIVNRHLRKKVKEVNGYVDFLQAVAEFFRNQINW